LILSLFFLIKKCVVAITEYLNSNPFQYQEMGKPNKTPESNGPRIRFLYEKNALQARFFCEKNMPQEKLM